MNLDSSTLSGLDFEELLLQEQEILSSNPNEELDFNAIKQQFIKEEEEIKIREYGLDVAFSLNTTTTSESTDELLELLNSPENIKYILEETVLEDKEVEEDEEVVNVEEDEEVVNVEEDELVVEEVKVEVEEVVEEVKAEVVEEVVLEEVVEEVVVEEAEVVQEVVVEEVKAEVVEEVEEVVEEAVVEEVKVEEVKVEEVKVVEQPIQPEEQYEDDGEIDPADIVQYYPDDFHEETPQIIIPKFIFIIPYRDRASQLEFFKTHMQKILEDIPSSDYKMLYIHQNDTRTFNRGAMKNIGFLHVKSLYPNDYKQITLVFNDVDTVPVNKNKLHYITQAGIVKHFYGYKFTLGGIVSITGADFERTGGFPNYWAWGYEDNAFQERVIRIGLKIDRTLFYPILDPNIIQFNDTLERIMNRKEFDRYWDEHIYSRVNDGFPTIHNLEYNIDNDFVNVSNFKTAVDEQPQFNQTHNLKNGSTPFSVPTNGRRRGRMGMIL